MENDSNDGPFPPLYTLLTENSESADRSATILPGIIVIITIIKKKKNFSLMLSCFWNPTSRAVISVCFPFLCLLFRHQSFQTLPTGRRGADSSEVWRSAWVGVDAFSCVCVCVWVCVCVQLLLKGCRGSLTRCQPAGRSALLYSTQFDISKLCYISLRLTAVPPFGKWAYLLSSRKTDTTLMSCWTWSYCQQPVSLA